MLSRFCWSSKSRKVLTNLQNKTRSLHHKKNSNKTPTITTPHFSSLGCLNILWRRSKRPLLPLDLFQLRSQLPAELQINVGPSLWPTMSRGFPWNKNQPNQECSGKAVDGWCIASFKELWISQTSPVGSTKHQLMVSDCFLMSKDLVKSTRNHHDTSVNTKKPPRTNVKRTQSKRLQIQTNH